MRSTRSQGIQLVGAVSQKFGQSVAVHSAVRAQLLQNVVIHAFKSKAQFDLVRSPGHKGIVPRLIRSPGVIEPVEAPQSNGSSYAADSDFWGCFRARSDGESWVGCDSIPGDRRINVSNHTACAHTQRVDHLRAENVRVLDTEHLPARAGGGRGERVDSAERLCRGRRRTFYP